MNFKGVSPQLLSSTHPNSPNIPYQSRKRLNKKARRTRNYQRNTFKNKRSHQKPRHLHLKPNGIYKKYRKSIKY